jgi:hypothetical protein
MKNPPSPRTLPRWLQAHPLLLAHVLGAVNRIQRFVFELRTLRGALIALVVALGIPTVVTAAAVVGTRTSTYPWLSEHAVLVSAALAAHALLTILRGRTRVSLAHTRSWLVATPAKTRPSRAIEIGGPLLVQFGVVAGLIAILATTSGASASGLLGLLAWTAGGTVVGAAVGAVWRLRPHDQQLEESRYVPRLAAGAAQPTLSGLSRWPVLQAIAWHRPENSRFLFVIAALSVPMGSSALLGLAIVAFWTLASYMTTLLRAVSYAGRRASVWLRATPIGFAEFAWALARRALVHQVIGTSLVGATLLVLGTPWPAVLQVGLIWLAIVILTSAIGLADAYRARSPTLRILLWVSATLAAEYRANGWAFPLAVTIAAAHIRGAMKHARA